MNCLAYCTASSYKIKSFYDQLKPLHATLYRDVIHVPVPGMTIGDVFYFSYGVTVCWGIERDQCLMYLNQVKEFEDTPLEEIEKDEFTFTFGEVPKSLKTKLFCPIKMF